MNYVKIRKNIHASEATILETLENHCEPLKDIRLVLDDKFCSYDAYNDDYILEFKTRYKRYDDRTQAEQKKIEKNLALAEELGKKFLYVVSDPIGLYVFSISKMIKDGYKFEWVVTRCPATSAFNRREYINKDVCYINFGEAHWSCLWKVEDERTEFDPISLFSKEM